MQQGYNRGNGMRRRKKVCYFTANKKAIHINMENNSIFFNAITTLFFMKCDIIMSRKILY